MIIQQVIPKDNFILSIVAENGKSGEFDVSPYIKGEAFEPLRNPEEFEKYFIGKYSVPLFEKEGLGEIFKINPPQSPFLKGGG